MPAPAQTTPPEHPVLNARSVVLSLLASLMLMAGLIAQFAPLEVIEGIFGEHAARVTDKGWVLMGLAVIVGAYNAITTFTRKRAALKRNKAFVA